MTKLVHRRSVIAMTAIAAVFIFIASILITARYSHSFQNWYTTNEYFDWHTMAISHFGVSHLALPFTTVVCVISLLIIYFIRQVSRHYGNTGLLKRGSSWVIAGYVALMLAFIFLLYQPHAALSIAVHFLVAIIYFVSIPVGMVMMGVYFIRIKKGFLGYASLGLGAIAFISGPVICMGASILYGDKGVAIPEFIQILSESIWICLLSLDLLRVKPA